MRRTTAGFLAFVSSFALLAALSASGVGAEAGSEAVSESPAAAECNASQPADVQIQAAVEQLRREHEAAPRPREDAEVIVLNNRGYNYGPGPRIGLDQVRAEARSSSH